MIPDVVNVATADYVGEYKILLVFDDGKRQLVDFGAFLSASMHPAIRDYLNPERFAQFRIEFGELVWGDYELCFPVVDLYNNAIDKSVVDRVAA